MIISTAENGTQHNDQQPLLLEELFQRLRQHDSEWLMETLSKRWDSVVEANALDTKEESLSGEHLRTHPLLDLTAPTLPESLPVSKYIQDLRAWDWSSTKLGAMATWSLDLRRLVNTCLWDQQPAALWIGPEHLGIYNEDYVQLLGSKHPCSLGRPYAEIWPELESGIADIMDACQQSGTPVRADNYPFVIAPHGRRQEIWASFAMSPVFSIATGEILGNYNNVQYHTVQEVLSRRMATLLTLGHSTAGATDTEDFWKLIIPGIQANAHDVPFAAVYVYTSAFAQETYETASSAGSNGHDEWNWALVDCIGVSVGPQGIPAELDAPKAKEVFTDSFHKALLSGTTLLMTSENGSLPKSLTGIKSRVHGDPCTSAVLFPVSPADRQDIYGFVLLGINPLATYDDSYQQFVNLLGRQCATSLASVVLIADEQRRAEFAANLAAQDHIRLNNKLVESQLEVAESKTRFKSIADVAPLAMIHFDASEDILYANQNWIDLTQHPDEQWGPRSWRDVVFAQDQAIVDAQWAKLSSGKSVNFEMRWRAEADQESTAGPAWTIMAASPELYPDGSVKSVIGCVTDISHQKWVESLQESRVKEAYAQKRNQESFMDMICHEARNPLSAIMLCTESILSSAMSKDNFERQMQAAQTIMACAQHQKRVIDDVLTISKLDSKLLKICHVETQPVEAITQALKIFDTEIDKHDIRRTLSVHASYHDLQITWLKLDSDRLSQILINLLTNAIKFTREQTERRIDITISASTSRPQSSPIGVPFQGTSHEDVPASTGDNIFLAIEVVDTGCGMTDAEMQHLFQRFRQASPKTHVKYGGSGLGLYISQQLTNMLGGAIGAISTQSGTAFAFYVKASRCKAPDSTPPTSIETTSQRSGHILVVEDNLINQKVLRDQLKRLGYQVSVANHGLEALEHIYQTRFCKLGGAPLDLMLLDVEMPVCNGLECAQRIRQMQKDAQIVGHLPIVGVTANARREQQQVALDAGMDSVLTKPFRLKQLADEMDRATKKFYG